MNKTEITDTNNTNKSNDGLFAAAADVNPLVIEAKVLGVEAKFYASIAKKIVENLLDVGQTIFNDDIKSILKKYGDLSSVVSVEILKTYNNINEAIQKEHYKSEIIKAIQNELTNKLKIDLNNNPQIKAIFDAEIKKNLSEISNEQNKSQSGGLSIKKIQKGGQQSLKRTAKSINEFLNYSVTASHILNMVKKGGKTKRGLTRGNKYNKYNKYNKTRRR